MRTLSVSPRHVSSSRRAFTLVEMAVVLVIISVVTGSAMVMGNKWVEASRYRATRQAQETIERALLHYIRLNRRLPCPGGLALNLTNTNGGMEGATPGTCTGGTPAATYNGSGAAANLVAGSVPVDALDLPRSMMLDGWGRKFVYYVDRRMTAYDAADTYPYDESVSIGVIALFARLSDGTVTERTDPAKRAVYALISAGPNGHGGYSRTGVVQYKSSTNADEWENCTCNATAATSFNVASALNGALLAGVTLTQTSPFETFDDIVVYKRRSQLYDIP